MMKLRNVLGLFLSVLLFSCGEQNSKEGTVLEMSPHDALLDYAENPTSSDSTCLKDIKEAKKDVANGKILFCYPMGFGTPHLRQEKALRKLCEKNNLIFLYEMFGCIQIEGQTQGCYGAFMDRTISDKFGINFKEELLAKADSILVASNDTVEYYLCDKSPQNAPKNVGELYLSEIVTDQLGNKLKADTDGSLPFMDIGFYIDKSGNASGYFSGYFMDANNKSNQKFREELFKIAIEQIKEIKHWEPGLVNGQKVITENNVRVYF